MLQSKFYEVIFEKNPMGIALFGVQSLKIELCNSIFAQSIGYTKDELVGQSIQLILSDEASYSILELPLQEKFSIEQSKKQEFNTILKYRQKDGRIIDIGVFVETLRMDNEEYIICYLRNISDLLKVEEALRLSESKMQAILDNSFESIVFIDLDRRIQFFNQIASTRSNVFFGKELKVGNSMYEMVLLEDKESIDRNFNRALLGKRTILDKAFLINNRDYWFEFQYTPVRNEKGEIIGVLYSGRDINEKKYAEEDLIQSELRFHAIFDQAPLGITLVESKTGKFVQVNPKFCAILGYKEEEIIEKRFLDITHPDDMQLSLYHWQTLLSGKAELVSFEKRYIKKDGNVVWTSLTRVPLFEKEKETKYHLLIAMDITESKKANETLNKYMKELENANQTKSKFFSIIAHDLRNPFYGILGITEILDAKIKKEILNESLKFYQRYIQMIQISAKSAFNLLENLMQWARSQTGEISVRPKNLSLDHLLSHTIPIVSGSAFKKNIAIEKDMEENDIVYVDESLVSTILRNLLTNSIKFTNSNGKIFLSTKRKNGFLEISIADTGVGINLENLGKIFKIDSKFSKPGTDNEKGTGLGLILCKEFVEMHGGKIWVESQQGKGSTFTFTLPLGK